MKKIFHAGEGFTVPDGTIVHSAVSENDISIAVGRIPAGVTSKIHLHPIVTQITWVLSGRLTVKMKDAGEKKPYTLDLTDGESAFTGPGTFFQLVNKSGEECRVLYVVTPGFIFECDEKGEVLYNDAIVLEQDWGGLEKLNWTLSEIAETDLFKKNREKIVKRRCSSAGRASDS